jgi:glycosyltransferase involved in cell wall biosynthesis
MIATRMNIGGPARQILELARRLSPALPVSVAAGRPAPDEGELTDPEVPVAVLPLVRPVRPATDAHALVACRQLVRAARPAVVHTHMAKAGALGRLAALSLGRERPKLVHTFHGHVLQGYFGPGQQRVFLALERALARHTDVLVAVSPEVRDELVDLGVGRREQYEVVPIGVDLDLYSRVKPRRPDEAGPLRRSIGVPGDAFLVGVVGRLVPVKDHATLLEALALVPQAHLAVIGDGELRPTLEQQARRLGLAGRAHFTGWRQDVAGALDDLDVVVLTSRNEGTPVALIEASAAGRAVVATDVGGVRHVVEHGRTGWLCPPGDAAALAARLAELVAHPGLAEVAGQEGRRLVTARFGLQEAAARHLELYRSLMASRP